MRLINCKTLGFEEFIGKHIPPYMILSHTWETCGFLIVDSNYKVVSRKVIDKHGLPSKSHEMLNRLGIDTCCIDKSSSAELTDAINSMFKWYKRAGLCIVYLSDFDSQDPVADFARCRWFTRGWTLQELIVPQHVQFYDAKWRYYGRRSNLGPELSRITGIALNVVSGGIYIPNRHAVAERMSWAARRETTREEDLAYCLFGIFGVNLPLLYGEGSRAFLRLQEIVKNSTDLTIFAWIAEAPTNGLRGIFARSIREFAHAKSTILKPSFNAEFVVTNRGLRIEKRLLKPYSHGLPRDHVTIDLMSLNCRFSYMASTTYLSIC
ncbi:hypothetical protein P171DRAFT_393149 [Karstenula rhodostoma CBS 690.94]|uniref:HET-domain-containing protein n=1 Tax=Karstenula rhodostoma CBS 690.94 TaxID=1392251 RepID=A0A9P4U8Z5_9PLEO|nr:hypothetical protein P171DRAFT_393149 [Karstenula rhodostoma CBS 690.94]